MQVIPSYNFVSEFNCDRCGVSISLAEYRQHKTCVNPECRRAHYREMKREQLKRLELENERISRRIAAAEQAALVAIKNRMAEEAVFVSFDVPSITSSLTPLPDERRALFRDHLNRIIEESERADSSPREQIESAVRNSAQPRPAELTACTVCRGKCCRNGGTEAYLSPESIRDYRDQHPELEAEQIAHQYLDRIPDNSYSGTCVFHGEHGCTLSREMRSVTCNDYSCRPLDSIREQTPTIPESSLIIISALDEDDRVIRTSIV